MKLRVLVALAIALSFAGNAWGHSAPVSKQQPLGWSFDFSCCAAFDCGRVADGEITATEGGWLIKATGETIPYSDKRVKKSKDEFFYRCAPGGDFASPKTLCIYTPDMAG